MYSKAQIAPLSAIPGVLMLILVIGLFTTMMNSLSCSNEKSQISQLDGEVSNCKIALNFADENATFFRQQYETLRDQNITKQDFVDLKIQVNDLNYNLLQINNQIFSLRQQFNNTVNVLNFSLALNFLLFPLTIFSLLDFTFFGLNYTKKFHVELVKIYHRIIKKESIITVNQNENRPE